MQNTRTAIDNDDPRRAWLARLGDLWQGPHDVRRSKHEVHDPRAAYVHRLQDMWRHCDEEDAEDDDAITEYHDAVRFRDALSFGSMIPAIPSGLPTGTTLRLMREQRHKFGGAA